MNRIINIIGRVLCVLGGIVLAIFLLLFFTNGFFAYIEYINENTPWLWFIIGGAAITLAFGGVLILVTSIVKEKSYDFTSIRSSKEYSRNSRGSDSMSNYSTDGTSSSSEASESHFPSPVLPENYYHDDGSYAGYKMNDRYYDDEGHSIGYDVGDRHYDNDGHSTGYRTGDTEYDSDGHRIGYWIGDTFYEDK